MVNRHQQRRRGTGGMQPPPRPSSPVSKQLHPQYHHQRNNSENTRETVDSLTDMEQSPKMVRTMTMTTTTAKTSNHQNEREDDASSCLISRISTPTFSVASSSVEGDSSSALSPSRFFNVVEAEKSSGDPSLVVSPLRSPVKSGTFGLDRSLNMNPITTTAHDFSEKESSYDDKDRQEFLLLPSWRAAQEEEEQAKAETRGVIGVGTFPSPTRFKQGGKRLSLFFQRGALSLRRRGQMRHCRLETNYETDGDDHHHQENDIKNQKLQVVGTSGQGDEDGYMDSDRQRGRRLASKFEVYGLDSDLDSLDADDDEAQKTFEQIPAWTDLLSNQRHVLGHQAMLHLPLQSPSSDSFSRFPFSRLRPKTAAPARAVSPPPRNVDAPLVIVDDDKLLEERRSLVSPTTATTAATQDIFSDLALRASLSMDANETQNGSTWKCSVAQHDIDNYNLDHLRNNADTKEEAGRESSLWKGQVEDREYNNKSSMYKRLDKIWNRLLFFSKNQTNKAPDVRVSRYFPDGQDTLPPATAFAEKDEPPIKDSIDRGSDKDTAPDDSQRTSSCTSTEEDDDDDDDDDAFIDLRANSLMDASFMTQEDEEYGGNEEYDQSDNNKKKLQNKNSIIRKRMSKRMGSISAEDDDEDDLFEKYIDGLLSQDQEPDRTFDVDALDSSISADDSVCDDVDDEDGGKVRKGEPSRGKKRLAKARRLMLFLNRRMNLKSKINQSKEAETEDEYKQETKPVSTHMAETEDEYKQESKPVSAPRTSKEDGPSSRSKKHLVLDQPFGSVSSMADEEDEDGAGDTSFPSYDEAVFKDLHDSNRDNLEEELPACDSFLCGGNVSLLDESREEAEIPIVVSLPDMSISQKRNDIANCDSGPDFNNELGNGTRNEKSWHDSQRPQESLDSDTESGTVSDTTPSSRRSFLCPSLSFRGMMQRKTTMISQRVYDPVLIGAENEIELVDLYQPASRKSGVLEASCRTMRKSNESEHKKVDGRGHGRNTWSLSPPRQRSLTPTRFETSTSGWGSDDNGQGRGRNPRSRSAPRPDRGTSKDPVILGGPVRVRDTSRDAGRRQSSFVSETSSSTHRDNGLTVHDPKFKARPSLKNRRSSRTTEPRSFSRLSSFRLRRTKAPGFTSGEPSTFAYIIDDSPDNISDCLDLSSEEGNVLLDTTLKVILGVTDYMNQGIEYLQQQRKDEKSNASADIATLMNQFLDPFVDVPTPQAALRASSDRISRQRSSGDVIYVNRFSV